MSEYSKVEKPFLEQSSSLGWTVIDQGGCVPQDASPSLRAHFRQWLPPQVIDEAMRSINRIDIGLEMG